MQANIYNGDSSEDNLIAIYGDPARAMEHAISWTVPAHPITVIVKDDRMPDWITKIVITKERVK